MTFVEEIVMAGRGIVALATGRSDAYRFFDLSLKGLAGSMAAFFIALLIGIFLPQLSGVSETVAPAWQGVTLTLIQFALGVGFAALILKQFGRQDGLVPYIVADNWASFFMTSIATVLALLHLSEFPLILALGILTIFIEINIARLILTLNLRQVVGFVAIQFAAQLATAMVAVMIFGYGVSDAGVAGG